LDFGEDICYSFRNVREGKVAGENDWEKNMRVNVEGTTHFRVLSGDQIEGILGTALEILEMVGVQINDEETVTFLKKEGARVEGEALVRVPSVLVKGIHRRLRRPGYWRIESPR
jgi:trimethylamine:corrinoid methyltransferase-like protein